ncbi:MAG TPA: LytR C-terminal domain-containing protein [Gaiellaceae bacterium]|nr:LytR C-terminal domain-containing protein [Gaiellaceae bacterium]
MDHYAPAPDLAYRWRTRTMIVTAVAGVELLALVAVGVLVLGKGWFQQARASATTTPKAPAAHHGRPAATTTKPAPKPHHTAPATPMLTRAQTSLLVLNGNGQSGAAGAAATALRAHGYAIRSVGNAKRDDYAASMVMYRPGLRREALRLAQDMGFPIVSPLDGLLPSQLDGAKLLVIVGK